MSIRRFFATAGLVIACVATPSKVLAELLRSRRGLRELRLR